MRDADKVLVGVVGQGGQLYARVPHDSGTLKVSWNEQKSACLVSYQVSGRQQSDLIPLNGSCRKE
ncbi:hypothetical protein OJE16_10550 [Pantoea tagorei]